VALVPVLNGYHAGINGRKLDKEWPVLYTNFSRNPLIRTKVVKGMGTIKTVSYRKLQNRKKDAQNFDDN
jgi:hypothetical protein